MLPRTKMKTPIRKAPSQDPHKYSSINVYLSKLTPQQPSYSNVGLKIASNMPPI